MEKAVEWQIDALENYKICNVENLQLTIVTKMQLLPMWSQRQNKHIAAEFVKIEASNQSC